MPRGERFLAALASRRLFFDWLFSGETAGQEPAVKQDARSAGRVRAALEIAGKPIGAHDLLIAGPALRHKLTLVNADAREFARGKDLVWEDWARR